MAIDVNITCIDNELKRIIHYKKHYDCVIILYALATLELIILMKSNNQIHKDFIRFLNVLSECMNCYIDFNFYNYLYNNNVIVMIKYDELESSSSSSWDMDFSDRINNMIEKDSIVVNTLINSQNNAFNDEFGLIDSDLINSFKKLFDLIDYDKDGYISALDAIRLHEISLKYAIIFDYNINSIIINLLTSDNNKIDFIRFMMHAI